jgi:hypothetical protein
MTRKFLLALGLLLASTVDAGETGSAIPGVAPPKTDVSSLSWLAGAWHGTGLQGAKAAEFWSAAAGGQMVAHFQQLNAGGAVQFYEIIVVAPRGDSLEMRIKHFNPDLRGWEERGEFMSFPLVAVEKSTWYFDGLTLRRDSNDQVTYFVRIQDRKDRPATEIVFKLSRRGGNARLIRRSEWLDTRTHHTRST